MHIEHLLYVSTRGSTGRKTDTGPCPQDAHCLVAGANAMPLWLLLEGARDAVKKSGSWKEDVALNLSLGNRWNVAGPLLLSCQTLGRTFQVFGELTRRFGCMRVGVRVLQFNYGGKEASL